MFRRAIIVFLAAVAACVSHPAVAEDAGDFFEKEVRPLLVKHCLECHGKKDPEGGLLLTSRDALMKGGKSGPAVVAGDAEKSLLVAAIRQTGELKMPPSGKLSDQEIAVLSQWVSSNLPWPDTSKLVQPDTGVMQISDADRGHWSFLPIVDPPLPPVKQTDWPRTTIDQFILAKLEGANLTPSPPADRRTLLRRVYVDLIGMLPTWEEIQAFEGDNSPAALERVVDHLLASPRYGERWGRHWLDVARYADTKDGVLMYGDDRIRPFAYTYRDYVIRALNEDIPFDQFVRDQLAADLVSPPVEPWRLGAMGFLTLGRMYDNNVHDVIDDQIDTVSRGFLGLTIACARCHNHKYDPIPTADYYSLYGIFASSEIPLELPAIERTVDAPGSAPFENEAAAKRAAIAQFRDEQFEMLTETARQRVGDYLVHVATTEPDPLEQAIYFLSLAPEDLRPPIIARWRRYLELHAQTDDPVFGPWHDLLDISTPLAGGAADSAAVAGGNSGASAGANSSADVTHSTFNERAKQVLAAWSSREKGILPGQVNPVVLEALSRASLNDRADVPRAYGELLHGIYEQSKSSISGNDAAADPARRQLLELVVGQQSPLYFPKSQTRKFMSRKLKDEFGGKLQELDRMAVKSPTPPVARAMVVNDANPLHDPRIFVRGNPSQLGEPVPRRFLEVLVSGERTPFPRGSGRLDLAEAIANSNNPLTARVIVNRVWMHHFGEPLVSTPSDFGKRSTPPVQGELLNHLAWGFMQEGWSLKKLHKRIILSRVYQQSSLVQGDRADQAIKVDPENRLYWRMNRRRLDFESMRDTLLALSGRLEHRRGGRPVDLSSNPNANCRTVFGMVDRQSLPEMYRAFDFASPDQSVERRPKTTVPQQALFAMNSAFVIEQAKGLAARSIGVNDVAPERRILAMFHIVYGRDPTSMELEAVQKFLQDAALTAGSLTPWEQLAQVLLQSNELTYVD